MRCGTDCARACLRIARYVDRPDCFLSSDTDVGTYERDGVVPKWRGIYDDRGRLMVVINFNMDLGDAWEHADVPQYALMYTARAYKFTINYMLYAMTH